VGDIERLLTRGRERSHETEPVQTSTDNTTWTTRFSTTTGDGGIDTITFPAVSARYVRMNGTQRTTVFGYSLFEFEVYPAPAAPVTNLALNKAASSTSNQDTGFTAAAAFDGNPTTRWSSTFSDPQSITVDLGSAQSVGSVVLKWEAAYGRAYQVQTSTDNSTWTTRFSTTTADGGTDTITFAAAPARYVRMAGTQRATQYGYSLFEFEVYAA